MNNTKQTMGIFMIAAIASMLIVGTGFAPMQSFAGKDTEDYKNEIREEVDIREKDDAEQKMNQENICYRSDDCRNSNLGLQTAGDDNQVTGFNDQSDNFLDANLTDIGLPF